MVDLWSGALSAEQVSRRLAPDHPLGNGIGVLLVGVAGLPDAALELDPTALLDDMRRLVRYGVQ